MVATALSLPTQFIVLSCHSGSEGPFTGLSLARQGYCFCLFFFLVDKSGSDGDINFSLPVFSCVWQAQSWSVQSSKHDLLEEQNG